MLPLAPFSDTHVTLVSTHKNTQLGTTECLQACYSCGMGPGVGHRLREWARLFSCHFELYVIQIMLRTKQAITLKVGS